MIIVVINLTDLTMGNCNDLKLLTFKKSMLLKQSAPKIWILNNEHHETNRIPINDYQSKYYSKYTIYNLNGQTTTF